MEATAVPRREVVPSSVLGMLLFVFTEVMLLAGMISAHAIARSGASAWPPLNQPRLPIAITLLNTVALAVSGAMLVWAQWAWRRSSQAVNPPLFGVRRFKTAKLGN